MGAAIALGFVTAGISSWSLPHGLIPLLLGAAFACFALAIPLARAERANRLTGALGQNLLLAVMAIPMALSGFALALWVTDGLSWQWALAVMICLSAVSALMLAQRSAALLGVKLAQWWGFALPFVDPVGFAALAAASVALVLLAYVQSRGQEREEAQRRARERIRTRAEEILWAHEEAGLGWFWETDRRGLISYISPCVCEIVGKPPARIIGQELESILRPDEGDEKGFSSVGFFLRARAEFKEIAVRAAGDGQEARWWAVSGRPVSDSFGNFCGFRGAGIDLTQEKKSQETASRLAHYDALTGLANRRQMGLILDRILGAESERERECAVMMLDLDRFKPVNDTFGHPTGDRLLQLVARRLESVIGEDGRVGRLGGDEFQIILPGRCDRTHLEALARRVIEAVSQPFPIDGKNIIVGTSIGVVCAPEDADNSEALSRKVDLALYAAKDAGRGCVRFFASQLEEIASEHASLERDLREALARDALELFYQPVISVSSERVVGFEALLRWPHPQRGWLSPDKFIPVAEDCGLIDAIGEWALKRACRDLAKWSEPVFCAVNVSPMQFSNPKLAGLVDRAINDAGIDPARLELEITESVFLSSSEASSAMFASLKACGVRLVLDDFGTGYSSLGYLQRAPFDKIKIDKGFVHGATESTNHNAAIIEAIASLARTLGMKTTAEGVETQDELGLIRAIGCNQVQGNVYSRPLNFDDASDFLARNGPVSAKGPMVARSARSKVLRHVDLLFGQNRLQAIIRNQSENGAMLEGVRYIAPGTQITLCFSGGHQLSAEVRWCDNGRLGCAFADGDISPAAMPAAAGGAG